MARDYFDVLGLAPGRYAGQEVARRFFSERARLLARLDEPATYGRVRRQLDELHLAYAALRDPQGQADALRAGAEGADRVAALKVQIAASLEDGLLRYSRRQEILREARQIGLSDFQAHLLIAQVQFGDDGFAAGWVKAGGARSTGGESRAGIGLRLAAAGVLALTLFLALVHWLAV
jgi:hypothetical protein